MLRRVGILCGLLMIAAGCGGGVQVVPVSGTVYLDGKPKAGLHVTFQPLGSKATPNPGRGSHGITDADGKYTLTYDGTRPGAVVGEHKVAICTVLEGEGENVDPETGSADGTPVKGGQEIIPVKYNDRTILTFDVPRGGTDKANFELSSK
jgi:hypothetical protein